MDENKLTSPRGFLTQRRRDAEVFFNRYERDKGDLEQEGSEKRFSESHLSPSSLLINSSASLRLCVSILFLTAFAAAQVPTVEKIEPPNWWTGMSVNPVRILLRGTNLKNAAILVPQGSGLKPGNLKWSDNGHYLFFDLTITPAAKQGRHKLIVSKQNSSATFNFDIFPRAPRENKYQGYTPDDVIYLLMPDRFANGDTSNDDPVKSKGLYDRSKTRRYHGGDLQGVIDKLPYLKSLGVTAVWTTPVYDNNDKLDFKEFYDNEPTTGYHGYGAVDMYNTDEHFGEVAKLKEFVEKAHSLGLKVIQDQVANHTGPFHVWASDPPTPTWWNGTLEHHTSNNWQKWTTMNPRATYQTQARNQDGWFIDILPDFNQHDPEVEKYLIQNSLWWVETAGYDAIRMDTLPHVPRSFWAKWGAAIKREYPKVNILGELYDGDPALLAYFQTGRKGHDGIDTQIDTLFDFGLFYQLRDAFGQGKSIRGVSQMFAHDWLYPRPEVLTTFIGVHDMARFMNEPGATVDGLKLADTLIMTSRGTPIIYYGDEIAMPGGGDPDNRRDFPGGFPGDARTAFTASGRTATENDVFNYLSKLGKLRQELEPLRRGKTLDLLDEEQQLAYARVTDKGAVIVVFNNDAKASQVNFDISMLKMLAANATLTDALGKVGEVKVEGGKVKFTMPARTAAIFTPK
jgi:glycosidase